MKNCLMITYEKCEQTSIIHTLQLYKNVLGMESPDLFKENTEETINIDKVFEFLGDNKENIKLNTKYYSKNSKLYKLLNNKKYYNLIENIQYEKREKIENIGKKILICLPPGIGLGDSVEYALFSKALIKCNLFE